jgi:solute carrier family 25 citrate transporter 1
MHAVQVLVRAHGFAELYRGLIPTTLKQSATSAVRMGTYNTLKEVAKAQGLAPSVLTTFGMGATAGVVTVYATQPFDTVKTRAQGVKGAGLVEAVQSVYLEHGVRGFWKGSTMRLGRLLLSGGIVFSIYEQMTLVLSGVAYQ